jgi:hypothetical protein
VEASGFCKCLSLLALLFIMQAPVADAKNKTPIFQQGLSGYSGVRDTFISTEAWDTPPQFTRNYGQNEQLAHRYYACRLIPSTGRCW